jgi:UDP-N-acetylglucosamine enolpyruvyl transferase
MQPRDPGSHPVNSEPVILHNVPDIRDVNDSGNCTSLKVEIKDLGRGSRITARTSALLIWTRPVQAYRASILLAGR